MEISDKPNLYEIHIIVGEKDVAHLFKFWANLKNEETLKSMINCRCTLAQTFYGNYPTQPMLTYWLRGDDNSCMTYAFMISQEMRINYLMNILRIKVEAVATNESVPKELPGDSLNYYEFHFKVDYNKESNETIAEQWDDIAMICSGKYGAHLFFNPYSKKGSMIPVITLRRYYTTYEKALQDAVWLSEDLERAGYKRITDIQKEYSVLDTNVHMDEGWLFNKYPNNFITYVPKYIGK